MYEFILIVKITLNNILVSSLVQLLIIVVIKLEILHRSRGVI